jgi:hypothetical protein
MMGKLINNWPRFLRAHSA